VTIGSNPFAWPTHLAMTFELGTARVSFFFSLTSVIAAARLSALMAQTLYCVDASGFQEL
jgi:hypothetical protein